jgi:HSP20 family protein
MLIYQCRRERRQDRYELYGGTDMNSMTVYDRDFPAFRLSDDNLLAHDPFEFMDRLFSGEPLVGGEMSMPAVDVREEDKRYLIEAELPGLSEKDVKLELKSGVLELSTEKKEETEEKEGSKWIRHERREASFRRSFILPEDADGEKIVASFKDGLLTVELPKKAESAARLVPVKAA